MADWGPQLWSEFHAYAVSYKYIQQEEAIQFYTHFASKIPCETCKAKYLSLLDGRMQLRPEHLESKETLFKWTWVFHNIVNMLLHKPQMSLKEATEIHFMDM
jgi:predicted ATP-grasp superfamily ATP-dependent carboligase